MVLLTENPGGLGERDARIGDGHKERRLLIERRHELRADGRGRVKCADQQGQCSAERDCPVPQSPSQCGAIDGPQQAHDRVVIFAVQLAADEEGAQDGDQGDGQYGGTHHREGLGEGQRMKHFAFHSGKRENRNEGQDDDDHGKRDWPAHEPGRLESDLTDVRAIVAVLRFVLLRLANDVLCHHDACVYQHADGDCDSSERHDVRRDARALHEQESAQDRERQWNGDHEDAAEMP